MPSDAPPPTPPEDIFNTTDNTVRPDTLEVDEEALTARFPGAEEALLDKAVTLLEDVNRRFHNAAMKSASTRFQWLDISGFTNVGVPDYVINTELPSVKYFTQGDERKTLLQGMEAELDIIVREEETEIEDLLGTLNALCEMFSDNRNLLTKTPEEILATIDTSVARENFYDELKKNPPPEYEEILHILESEDVQDVLRQIAQHPETVFADAQAALAALPRSDNPSWKPEPAKQLAAEIRSGTETPIAWIRQNTPDNARYFGDHLDRRIHQIAETDNTDVIRRIYDEILDILNRIIESGISYRRQWAEEFANMGAHLPEPGQADIGIIRFGLVRKWNGAIGSMHTVPRNPTYSLRGMLPEATVQNLQPLMEELDKKTTFDPDRVRREESET